jgi:hypothetical protein
MGSGQLFLGRVGPTFSVGRHSSPLPPPNSQGGKQARTWNPLPSLIFLPDDAIVVWRGRAEEFCKDREWRADVIAACTERFERRLVEEVAGLRVQIAQTEAVLRRDMAQMGADIRTEMAQMGGGIRQEIATAA